MTLAVYTYTAGAMALAKDDLLAKLAEWNVQQTTIQHELSPTCEIHSQNLKGTAFEKFIGKGQAKNLFFKVPSGGGVLKNRLFLVCALVETEVDNKALSGRLGIKQSAPLRFASDDIFDDVLQIPKGSVNPFVLAQQSCSEVFLLLDKKFQTCEGLLFHPMQSDFTTCLTPKQLDTFLERAAPNRFTYIDLSSSDKIDVPPMAPTSKPTQPPVAVAPVAPVAPVKEGGSSGSNGWYSKPYETVMGWTL